MRLLTAISLALVVLIALACTATPAGPAPTATPLPYLAFQLDVRISPNDAATFMLNPSPLGKGGYSQGGESLETEGGEI